MRVFWLKGSVITMVVSCAAILVSVVLKEKHVPQELETATIDVGPVTSFVRTTGWVNSTDDVRLSVLEGGSVRAVKVSVGSEVRVGQELLQIDGREIELQVITDEIAAREVEANIAHQSSIIKGLRTDFAAGAASHDEVRSAEQSLSLLYVQREKAVARINQTRARLERSVLRSPIAGTVTEISIRPGEVAVAGQPIITVSDSANQQIIARIEQHDARDLRIDMPVHVSLEGARGLDQEERILRIEPTVRKEGNVGYTAAWVSLKPSALRLRHNQQVEIRIPIGSDKSVTRVPIEALTTYGGNTVAWSIDSQGSLRPKAIVIGRMGDRFAEISSGLSPGQAVVLVEGRTFNEGDQARAKVASKP